jgi:hypothetical protein
MAVALILMWTTSSGTGGLHVGDFLDMKSCQAAANSSEAINRGGPSAGLPAISFVCVTSRGP